MRSHSRRRRSHSRISCDIAPRPRASHTRSAAPALALVAAADPLPHLPPSNATARRCRPRDLPSRPSPPPPAAAAAPTSHRGRCHARQPPLPLPQPPSQIPPPPPIYLLHRREPPFAGAEVLALPPSPSLRTSYRLTVLELQLPVAYSSPHPRCEDASLRIYEEEHTNATKDRRLA